MLFSFKPKKKKLNYILNCRHPVPTGSVKSQKWLRPTFCLLRRKFVSTGCLCQKIPHSCYCAVPRPADDGCTAVMAVPKLQAAHLASPQFHCGYCCHADKLPEPWSHSRWLFPKPNVRCFQCDMVSCLLRCKSCQFCVYHCCHPLRHWTLPEMVSSACIPDPT